MTELRKAREVGPADVLLAAQHSKRALHNDSSISRQWHLKGSGTAAAGSCGAGGRIGIVDDDLQTGITRTFGLSGSQLRVEHVTLRLTKHQLAHPRKP